ncbi:MAG: hypothetical protein LBU27_06675 [Candidatus Peribacteria bacterium]|jgi:plasmid maintenance system antidote protein VapI|nr:hypothetical protein [Candidatus Peribacteria bacterium]
MTTNIDLDVPYAFHPGEYLKRALQEENISQKSFAAVLGVSRFEVNLIIK